MIEIESRELADIPVLHAYPVGQKDTPLPCVIFYHGFTSSSLVYSYFAVALAQAGLRVIMPDAPDHGSRFSGDAARQVKSILANLATKYAGIHYLTCGNSRRKLAA